MIYLAQSSLAVTEDELDQNNYLFNLANGTFDLEHDTFYVHKPEDNITKISKDVTYDLKASCPEWLKFLNTVFEGNRNIINFVQRAIGYSLCGDTSGVIYLPKFSVPYIFKSDINQNCNKFNYEYYYC
jgi:putative DNA primase/helicase